MLLSFEQEHATHCMLRALSSVAGEGGCSELLKKYKYYRDDTREMILEDPMVSSDGPIASAKEYLTQRKTKVEDASRPARTCWTWVPS